MLALIAKFAGRFAGAHWVAILEWVVAMALGALLMRGWLLPQLAHQELITEQLRTQQATQLADQRQATLVAVQASAADMHHAAMVATQATVNLTNLLQGYQHARFQADLPTDCRPDDQRVRELSAYYDAVHQAVVGGHIVGPVSGPAPEAQP